MPLTAPFSFYTLKPNQLADWLQLKPTMWWYVDGDPHLTSRIDFPCPTEELVDELRGMKKQLRIFDSRKLGNNDLGEIGDIKKIGELGNTENNSNEPNFLLSWDGDNEWLLMEDREAAAAAQESEE